MKRWTPHLILFLLSFPPGLEQGKAQQNNGLLDSMNRLNYRVRSGIPLLAPDTALAYARQALDMAQRLGDRSGIAQALISECICLNRKGNSSDALDLGLKALKIFEDIRMDSLVGYSCIHIAQVYKDIGGDKRTVEYLNTGLDYCRRACQVYTNLKDTNGLVGALNEEGVIYRDHAITSDDNRYYDSAFADYALAIRLSGPSGTRMADLGHLYNNISQIYTEYQKDYPEALHYLQQAIDYNVRHNNIRSLSFNYCYIAHLYDKMGDPQRALVYALKTLAIAQQLGTPERLVNAYGQLSESYRYLGRYDSALFYNTRYNALSDSLANLDKTRQIADMQAKYESVRKESQIQNLNTQILLLAVGLAAAFLIAGLLFWLYKRVNGDKKIITRQSKQMETMMKELHHRVKNNLQIVTSLLNLQTYRLNDDQAIDAIRQSQQRVHAMSLIHQRLYKTDITAFVNIKEYLTDLSESLLSSYGYDRDGFDLRVSAQDELLDVDKLLLLGLIVNEIVTNAFKYAYKDIAAPSLYIEYTSQKEHIVLTITNNGQPWDGAKWTQEGAAFGKEGSFGKQLVSNLCRQLKGTQELTVGDGTCFTFIFPRPAQTA
jgi:two-component sensor histidine kinase/tetratricopeptide (TPR) repeat protein